MPAYFLDTSALVKLYIDEIGSNWILNLFASNNEIFVAAIAEVELISAITRRSRGANISPTNIKATCSQIRSDFQTEYQVIAINETIIASATTFAETYGLRAYDAVQLAAGQAVNQLRLQNKLTPVSFVSADNKLNAVQSQQMVMTQIAFDEFLNIVKNFGGVLEQERANRFLDRLIVVPGNPSIAAQSLQPTRRLDPNDIIILGTGDQMRIVTMTADAKAVRAASAQGVDFNVYLHPPYPLTGR